MAVCIINNGYSLGCKDNTGGVRKVYIATFATDNIYEEDSDNQITSMLNSTSGAIDFYTFEQRQEVPEFNQAGNFSIENGTKYYEQTLSLTFTKNDATLRNTIALIENATAHVVIETQNDDYLLMGKTNGCDITESTVGTGKAYGDLNGTTVTLTAKEPDQAHFMTSAGFATLNVI